MIETNRYQFSRRVSLNSPAAPKMQASPVSGFSVNGSPGLTRAHQGSPGLTRVQQTSPGLARAQQAKLQGSPGLASGTQGSPGDKLMRKGTPGEGGNRAGGVGSRKGQHQRWVLFIWSDQQCTSIISFKEVKRRWQSVDWAALKCFVALSSDISTWTVTLISKYCHISNLVCYCSSTLNTQLTSYTIMNNLLILEMYCEHEFGTIKYYHGIALLMHAVLLTHHQSC